MVGKNHIHKIKLVLYNFTKYLKSGVQILPKFTILSVVVKRFYCFIVLIQELDHVSRFRHSGVVHQ